MPRTFVVRMRGTKANPQSFPLPLTQVNDVPLVHVLDPLADLPHVVDDLRLGHGVSLRGDLLEQLPAGQAARGARLVKQPRHQAGAGNAA